jgi:hypothetical protein
MRRTYVIQTTGYRHKSECKMNECRAGLLGPVRREGSQRPERAGFLVARNGRTIRTTHQRAASGPGDALPRTARGGSDVKKLLFLVTVAVVGAALLSSQDDIRRYLKMRSM